MSKKLKFIDLFAGIGGFHYALRSLGMECVFTSEIDDFARKTYSSNFKDNYLKDLSLFAGDIWEVDINKIPDFFFTFFFGVILSSSINNIPDLLSCSLLISVTFIFVSLK